MYRENSEFGKKKDKYAHLELLNEPGFENSRTLRANPCKNRPKSPIRGKAQKIKIALLLQTGRL